MPGLLIIAWLAFNIPTCLAILPEEIGATQFATGHLSAAERYRKTLSKIVSQERLHSSISEKYYDHLEKFLLNTSDHSYTLRTMFRSPEERREFLRIALIIQENDQSMKPRLIMIGENRGIAVDGHHRIRTIAKINQMIYEAYKLWPDEMQRLLAPMGRIKPDGTPILSFHYKKIKIVSQLPETATAAEVVRELLALRMGLWEYPEDQGLANKHYGTLESKKASEVELKELGKKLNILDDSKSGNIQYSPVAELPDSPVRTLIGKWFDSRYLKIGFNFRDYSEFYVGDEIKKIISDEPGKHPNIENFLQKEGLDIHFQKKHLPNTLGELDQILLTNVNFRERLTRLSRNPRIISHGLLSVHLLKYCSSGRISNPDCINWSSKALFTKKSAQLDSNCIKAVLKKLTSSTY